VNDPHARYVISSHPLEQVWHRVDEAKTRVYTTETRCGKVYAYPSRAITFNHPKQQRGNQYPDCQECAP
jgi:hypothetical protein